MNLSMLADRLQLHSSNAPSAFLKDIVRAMHTTMSSGLQSTWQIFEQMCSIPHPSGGEHALIKAILRTATDRGWLASQDATGNMRIDVPGRGHGVTAASGLVLQAHLDMVLKASDGRSIEELSNTPIMPRVQYLPDGTPIVAASGTTLGADNGIGVALALALAADPDIAHSPPLRILLTVNEERGLIGARGLAEDFVTDTGHWKYCLGLDVGNANELRCGSAGAQTIYASWLASFAAPKPGSIRLLVRLDDFQGGHSGLSIHHKHANPISVLAGILIDTLSDKHDWQLESLTGGSNRNSIPTFCEAVLTVPATGELAAKENWFTEHSTLQILRNSAEANLTAIQQQLETEATPVLDAKHALPILQAIAALPHGVTTWLPAFAHEQEVVPESSLNVARVSSNDSAVQVTLLPRSFSSQKLEELRATLAGQLTAAGASLEFDAATPGWQGNPNSRFARLIREAAKSAFDTDMITALRHSGQETGMLARFFPAGNIFGLGPNIRNHHEPDEYVEIQSVADFYATVSALLKLLH